MIALLVAISYYAGSQIGFLFTPPDSPISSFWPPNAILLAVFLLAPLRIWWVLVLAVFPAHFLIQLRTGIPALSAFGWFVGNVGEALLGAACIRHFQNEKKPLFASVQGVVTFLIFGVFLAPLLTSFLDAGSTALTGLGRGYWALWGNRLTSNMIANLTVAPAVVTFVAGGIRRLWNASRDQLYEGALLIAGTAAVSLLVFARGSLFSHGPAFICAPFSFLVWAAVRFGPAGLSFTMLEVTLISMWSAMQGIGIFEYSPMPDRVVSVRILLGLFVLPLMLMAAVVAERRRNEEALEDTRGMLISAHEKECHSIARELHTDIAGQLTLAGLSVSELPSEFERFSEKLLLNKLYDQISGALEATLHLSHKIYPFKVEYLGLARALTSLCLDAAAEGGMIITPSVEGVPSNITLGVSLRIFRVAQLALQDIQERQAKTATVELKTGVGQILLRMTDDGVSMVPGRPEGAGLAYMRAQVLSLGGALKLMRAPCGRIVIEASVPITDVPA
jgi:integral membrane sensor domain MASE1